MKTYIGVRVTDLMEPAELQRRNPLTDALEVYPNPDAGKWLFTPRSGPAVKRRPTQEEIGLMKADSSMEMYVLYLEDGSIFERYNPGSGGW